MYMSMSDFNYIDMDTINKSISSIESKSKKVQELKGYLNNNVRAISEIDSFIKRVNNSRDVTSIEKESMPNSVDTISTEVLVPDIDIDYYFNMIINCRYDDLNNLLLNVIVPNNVLYPLLARIQKEYTSYYKMEEEYEKAGDQDSAMDCKTEMFHLVEIIEYIKNFDSLKDDDINELVEDVPVNSLIYLTSGGKNLPFDDLGDIPNEYYPSIQKLLVGMSYGRFNKIKSIYDTGLMQVSDGKRVRVYFQHIKDNYFLIAGIYLYSNNGKDKFSKIFIDKRDALCKNYMLNNAENFASEQDKIFRKLNRGGF